MTIYYKTTTSSSIVEAVASLKMEHGYKHTLLLFVGISRTSLTFVASFFTTKGAKLTKIQPHLPRTGHRIGCFCILLTTGYWLFPTAVSPL